MEKFRPLTRSYSKEDLKSIKKWRSQLKFFDFSIDWEGPDLFILKLAFQNKTELFYLLKNLGVTLERIPEDYERRIPFKTYSEMLGDIIPRPEIKDFPDYFQPQFIYISNVSTYCLIENQLIKIYVDRKSENNYRLTKTNFKNSLKIEEFIKAKKLDKYASKFRFCENYILD